MRARNNFTCVLHIHVPLLFLVRLFILSYIGNYTRNKQCSCGAASHSHLHFIKRSSGRPSQPYVRVINIIATVLALSMRVLCTCVYNRVGAIHACTLYMRVQPCWRYPCLYSVLYSATHIYMIVFHQSCRNSANQRMFFCYRHVSMFVFFQASVCSFVTAMYA